MRKSSNSHQLYTKKCGSFFLFFFFYTNTKHNSVSAEPATNKTGDHGELQLCRDRQKDSGGGSRSHIMSC